MSCAFSSENWQKKKQLNSSKTMRVRGVHNSIHTIFNLIWLSNHGEKLVFFDILLYQYASLDVTTVYKLLAINEEIHMFSKIIVGNN